MNNIKKQFIMEHLTSFWDGILQAICLFLACCGLCLIFFLAGYDADILTAKNPADGLTSFKTTMEFCDFCGIFTILFSALVNFSAKREKWSQFITKWITTLVCFLIAKAYGGNIMALHSEILIVVIVWGYAAICVLRLITLTLLKNENYRDELLKTKDIELLHSNYREIMKDIFNAHSKETPFMPLQQWADHLYKPYATERDNELKELCEQLVNDMYATAECLGYHKAENGMWLRTSSKEDAQRD